MNKPTCVKCQLSMRLENMGAAIVEMFNNPPRPYKLWAGDVWKCPQCEYEIVKGYSQIPLAEHYQDDFEEKLARNTAPKTRVVYVYERAGDQPGKEE